MNAEDQELLKRAQARLNRKRAKLPKSEPAVAKEVRDWKSHYARQAEEHARRARLEDAWTAQDREAILAEQPTAEEQAEARRLDLLRRWGVPAAYHRATRSTWKPSWNGSPSPWPPKVDGWRGEPWAVVFRGIPGVGKTHVAVAVLQEVADKIDLHLGRYSRLPDRVRFVSVPAACREIRDGYGRDDHGPAALYTEIATSYDLVLYDDVGAQSTSGSWTDVVSGWIYDRHAAALPTLVTCNTKGAKLALDERAARRLGDGIVIAMGRRG